MPLAKVGVAHSPQFVALGGLHCIGTLGPVAPGATVANTAIQASLPLACNAKIYKVGVSATALGDLLGLFNIVVSSGTQLNGAQAYTAGVVAPNDNSYTHNAANPAGTDSLGFPTNIVGTTAPSGAVANTALPVALFSADQALNAANGFATTGGTGIFLPPNFDAVYPAGSVLTLRAVTTAAGTAGLTVTVWGEVIGLRAGPVPSSTYYQAAPGVDY